MVEQNNERMRHTVIPLDVDIRVVATVVGQVVELVDMKALQPRVVLEMSRLRFSKLAQFVLEAPQLRRR